MEQTQNAATSSTPTIHWFHLGPGREISCFTWGKVKQDLIIVRLMDHSRCDIHSMRCSLVPWKASSHFGDFLTNPPIFTSTCCIRYILLFRSGEASSSIRRSGRYVLGEIYHPNFTPFAASQTTSTYRRSLVGRRKLLLWGRCIGGKLLGSLEVEGWILCWTKEGARHWLGRSRRHRTWSTATTQCEAIHCSAGFDSSGTRGQPGSNLGCEPWQISKPGDKPNPERNLLFAGPGTDSFSRYICQIRRQHSRLSISRRCGWLFNKGTSNTPELYAITRSPSQLPHTLVWMMQPVTPNLPSATQPLAVTPSSLRPNCPASQRVFRWRGANAPPPLVLDNPALNYLAAVATEATFRDPATYGAGLRKFHLFCNIFNVQEHDRLPASFVVLHSFALWAAAVPEAIPAHIAAQQPFEPVSVTTARKYLSAGSSER